MTNGKSFSIRVLLMVGFVLLVCFITLRANWRVWVYPSDQPAVASPYPRPNSSDLTFAGPGCIAERSGRISLRLPPGWYADTGDGFIDLANYDPNQLRFDHGRPLNLPSGAFHARIWTAELAPGQTLEERFRQQIDQPTGSGLIEREWLDIGAILPFGCKHPDPLHLIAPSAQGMRIVTDCRANRADPCNLILQYGQGTQIAIVSIFENRPFSLAEALSILGSLEMPGNCPRLDMQGQSPTPASSPYPAPSQNIAPVVSPYPVPPPATGTPYPVPPIPILAFPSPVPSVAIAQPPPAVCAANLLPTQAALLPEVTETVTATVFELLHPIQRDTRAVVFSDMRHGWVANGRSIFATQDGGASWAWLADLERPAQSLDFSSQARGWAVTTGGLWTTQDGGKSWNVVSLPVQAISGTLPMRTVDFASELRGWVGLRQTALRTSDGGQTWGEIGLPCQDVLGRYPQGWEYYDFSLVGEQDAWLVCGGEPTGAGTLAFKWLFRSQDDGRTWHKVAEGAPESFASPQTASDSGLAWGYWPDLFFLDEQHGWMGTVRTGLLASSDGGFTWVPVRMPVSEQSAAAPVFFSPDSGIVLSTGGLAVVWKTGDAGQTWTPVFPPPLPFGAGFANASLGYGIGGWVSPSDILRTQDGGRTWGQLSVPGKAVETFSSLEEADETCIRSVSAIAFLDRENGWALAGSCAGPASSLYRTSDGGQSWQRLPATLGPASDYPWLSFVDQQTGYIGNTLGQLYITRDGGNSVTLLEPAVDYDSHYQFISRSEGGKIANGQLFLTADGGCSWARALGGYKVLAFDLLPGGSIWAKAYQCQEGGDTSQSCKMLLLYSADRGQRWKLFHIDLGEPLEGDLYNLAAFDFIDPQNGWMRQGDHLYRTSDGGMTWEQVR